MRDKHRAGRGDHLANDRPQPILVDVDPKRPTGVSATDEESTAARNVAGAVRLYLLGIGWPEPLVAMTGNGYALL